MTNGPNLTPAPAASAIASEIVRIVADSLPILRTGLLESSVARNEELDPQPVGPVRAGERRRFIIEFRLPRAPLTLLLATSQAENVTPQDLQWVGERLPSSQAQIDVAVSILRRSGVWNRVMLGGRVEYTTTELGEQILEQILSDGVEESLQRFVGLLAPK